MSLRPARFYYDDEDLNHPLQEGPIILVDRATKSMRVTGGVGGGEGGGLTDDELRAAPVPVSGPLTDTQLRATAVPVAPSLPTVGTGAQGITWFRAPSSALLLATAQAVKASAGNVFGLHLLNPNAIPIYVKFFNVASASVTPGTTIPVHVIMVPANDAINDGQYQVVPTAFPMWNFSTAIAVFATSVRADTGTQTAPSVGLLAEVAYA